MISHQPDQGRRAQPVQLLPVDAEGIPVSPSRVQPREAPGCAIHSGVSSSSRSPFMRAVAEAEAAGRGADDMAWQQQTQQPLMNRETTQWKLQETTPWLSSESHAGDQLLRTHRQGK